MSIVQEMQIDMSQPVKDELNLLDTDQFNVFTISKETKGHELSIISNYLMRKHSLFNELMIDPYTFNNFTKAI